MVPLLIVLLSLVKSEVMLGVVAFKYVAPEECQWGFVSPDTDDVGLVCRLRSLNGDSLYSNFSAIPSEHTTSLTVECAEGVLVQSSLSNGSFEHLVQLKELKIEHCKMNSLQAFAFSGLHNLRNLTVRSYNKIWPAFNLEVQKDSFSSLRQLERLDLGYNSIWSLPPDVFCNLLSLFALNFTNNNLQDVDSLGFSPTSDGNCQLELKELDLSFNDLHLLPTAGFVKLRKLRKLYLENNQLTLVSESAFQGLNLLQILNLANNKLVSLPPEILQNVSELVELYLQNNSLISLPQRLLAGLQQLLVLDLHNNRLTSDWIENDTFEDLIRLVVLDLSENRVTKIDASAFRSLYNLQILHLEHNLIESIVDNAFSSMYNLHTLLLSHNKLGFVDAYTLNGLYVLSLLSLDFNEITSVHPDAFKNCSGLQDLNLHGNKLSSPPAALRTLQFLKTLDVGLNSIDSLRNASFRGLQQLNGLVLMDNEIGNLTRSTFSNMPALKILNLARNKIVGIEHGTFDGNFNLQAIRLDSNKLTDMNGLFGNLQGLIWLNISANEISWFDYALVPLGLQWLDIHANQIATLGNYFDLEAKLQLQIMDVSSNRITEISASSLPDGIQLLFLNDNRISKVQPFTFLKKNNLSRVDLFGNNIQIMDLSALRLTQFPDDHLLPEFYLGGNPFQCDCNMEWLQRINHLDQLRQHPKVMDLDSIYCRLLYSRDRTYIPLVEAQASQFLCPYSGHCFTLCQCCEFDACDCEMICPDNCTCYHDQSWSANIVVCSKANYTHMPEQIPMDATEIYIDGNNIKTLSSHTFIGHKNMRVLFLNDSQIQTINNRTFNGLRALQILHLEHNLLVELRGFEFERLETLRELYLQNNHLQTIHNASFVMLKSLEILRLDGNFLVTLPIWNLNLNPMLWEMTLSNNPWSCDCRFMDEFQTWLTAFQDKVHDIQLVRCLHNETNSPGSFVLAFNASTCNNATATLIMQPRLLQEHLSVLIIAACSLVAIALGIILCVVFRKELLIRIYSACGVRLFGRREPESDEHKLFDVFVVYSNKDANFVQQVLAHGLEQLESPYFVLLHYRDFPVGAYLWDTIVEAMDSSKRMIVVLSENFIKNEWCRFEFKAALMEVVEENKERVVIVQLGEVAQKDLDPDMRLLLKRNTHFQWGDKLFWEKLCFEMPDSKLGPSYNSRENAVRSAVNHI